MSSGLGRQLPSAIWLTSPACIHTHGMNREGVYTGEQGVNAMLRKVAVAAASKPHVEIRQNGEQFYIKTSTTVRTTEINFHIGEEFDEETVDGRKCKSLATWESENKIYCKQTLVDGDGPKTFWSRELQGDELILIFGADNVLCTRIYMRE
ncbi:cellular retinoic acid-binding protein 1 isoform X1 [Alosa sapidissima]|uniref:cellular retinoic acid-binding protein 1 isoform X1 n=2 Tax=Alosa sapidissima TaxID=34773 RepID=UPI001C094085|nr:cellular retinoic acid-binding protein 1 isoform X1 [Alosa sapidissima]